MIGSIKTYEENVAVYHTSIYRRYFMLFKSENSKLAEKAILGVCFLEKGGGGVAPSIANHHLVLLAQFIWVHIVM